MTPISELRRVFPLSRVLVSPYLALDSLTQYHLVFRCETIEYATKTMIQELDENGLENRVVQI
jgi:hypothetical protein